MADDREHPETLFTDRMDLPPPQEPLDLSPLPTHGGVYAFTDGRGTVIQTITTQNLRRSVALRLGAPDDATKRRANIRAAARCVAWTPAFSTFECSWRYLQLCRRLTPAAYRKHFGFAPSWFASIRPADQLPRWRPQTDVFEPGAVEIGPFPRRRQCVEFITLLEDIFDLCREHHILDRTPHGKACSYFEMKRCPAPCDGSIPLGRYHEMIASSVRFAAGATAERRAQMEAAMRKFARDRDYTRAAWIRDSLGRADRFLQRHASSIGPAADLRVLVVQRARDRAAVQPFFFQRGVITNDAPVRMADLATVADAWLQRLHQPAADTDVDPRHRSEHLWLVAHYLAKDARAPGVFLRECDAATTDKLIERVHAQLGRSPRRHSDKPSPHP